MIILKDTFYDFTQSTDILQSVSSSYSHSYSSRWMQRRVRSETRSTTATKARFRMVSATMRLERYYASVREEVSPLADDAMLLLETQDYVGFFKACGPNYVRGIRRAQEVTAVFTFRENSDTASSTFYNNVRSNGYGSNNNSANSANSIQSSLRIYILGFGLGLGMSGSETLVATSLAEYENIMKFAFRSMTQNKDSHHIGMVYGIEVVPWVDNTAYQVASRLLDENLEVPLPRSLIKLAFLIDSSDNIVFANTNTTREKFRCKDPVYEIDMYGYCCEINALYDFDEEEYNADVISERVCRPLRTLETSVVKNNMASNGEFVARLDRSARFRLNQLTTLEKCVSGARALPDRLNYQTLRSLDTVKHDATIEIELSLFELKVAIDPFNDYSLVKHMGKELDEWMDMYYQPCLAAIFGSNIGTDSDTDPTYFMAYPWHTHDECINLSCFGNSMRWDRENGGCTPSLITGAEAPSYQPNQDTRCSFDEDSTGDVEECKYKQADLKEYHTSAVACWNSNLPSYQVDYFMTHFCMPSLTGSTLSAERIAELEANYNPAECASSSTTY